MYRGPPAGPEQTPGQSNERTRVARAEDGPRCVPSGPRGNHKPRNGTSPNAPAAKTPRPPPQGRGERRAQPQRTRRHTRAPGPKDQTRFLWLSRRDRRAGPGPLRWAGQLRLGAVGVRRPAAVRCRGGKRVPGRVQRHDVQGRVARAPSARQAGGGDRVRHLRLPGRGRAGRDGPAAAGGGGAGGGQVRDGLSRRAGRAARPAQRRFFGRDLRAAGFPVRAPRRRTWRARAAVNSARCSLSPGASTRLRQK
ncbi:hypothetical protein Spla01_05946 [Streptomyces platensis]|uniref:Uncharacterized protein n=1 Tax=Streptomyces platensis TaxID=58346 RepID=A0ABX3XMW6_STRPT|nr:hypothetical protein BG653_06580 [Streptomyces platensis]